MDIVQRLYGSRPHDRFVVCDLRYSPVLQKTGFLDEKNLFSESRKCFMCVYDVRTILHGIYGNNLPVE